LTPVTVQGVQEFSVGSLAGTPALDPEAREVFVAWVTGDLGRRWPGAETGSEVVARFVAAVEWLADSTADETVLVVSHGGVMTLAIPNTAGEHQAGTGPRRPHPNCAVAEVEVDADGWRLVGPWPGRPWREPAADVAAPGGGRLADVSPGQNSRAPTSSIPLSAS
jgi:probable phosphoglycerate mutase